MDDINLVDRRSLVIQAANRSVYLLLDFLGVSLNLDKTGLLDYTLSEDTEKHNVT
jgi:hypothetical protein